MKPTPLDASIRSRIDSFLAELAQLVRASALEAVQQALGTSPTAAPAPRKRAMRRTRKAVAATPAPKPAARPSKRAKRTPEDVAKTAEAVLAYVKAHAGQRLEEIGRGMKAATKHLKLPIAKLMEAKQLRTEGQKRGTKYFVASGGAAPAAPQRRVGKRRAKK